MTTEGRFALGGLALLAVWLLVVLPLFYGQPKRAPPVQSQQHAYSAVQGEQRTRDEALSLAKPNQGDAPGHRNKGEDEGTEFWPPLFGYRLKITDTLLVAFTFGLTIFTGLLWQSTDKLWIAGEKQIRLTREALVSDQRAWLIVKQFRIERFDFGEIEGGAADAHTEIYFEIENVGRTPALSFYFRMVLLGNWATEEIAVREFADQCCKDALIYGGRMVSPAEKIEESEILFASGAELYRYGERGKIRPLIVGCITYRVLQDSELRQTAFVFRPEKVYDRQIFVQDGNMSVNDVVAMHGGGGFAT